MYNPCCRIRNTTGHPVKWETHKVHQVPSQQVALVIAQNKPLPFGPYLAQLSSGMLCSGRIHFYTACFERLGSARQAWKSTCIIQRKRHLVQGLAGVQDGHSGVDRQQQCGCLEGQTGLLCFFWQHFANHNT
jgi:hypothetical protein